MHLSSVASLLRPIGRLLNWLQSLAELQYGEFGDRNWELDQSWLTFGRWVHEADPKGGALTHAQVRARAAEIARCTLGNGLWSKLCYQGYLDVRSQRVPGLTYRLRLGRRVELIWDSRPAALNSPWPHLRYLCINPVYSMPAIEFAAQLYLYLRDWEDEIIRVAIAQPYDQRISHVF